MKTSLKSEGEIKFSDMQKQKEFFSKIKKKKRKEKTEEEKKNQRALLNKVTKEIKWNHKSLISSRKRRQKREERKKQVVREQGRQDESLKPMPPAFTLNGPNTRSLIQLLETQGGRRLLPSSSGRPPCPSLPPSVTATWAQLALSGIGRCLLPLSSSWATWPGLSLEGCTLCGAFPGPTWRQPPPFRTSFAGCPGLPGAGWGSPVESPSLPSR